MLKTNGEIAISEVDFDYEIVILESNSNFPSTYELYEENNEAKVTIQNNKTSRYHISKNNQYNKRYRLVVKWDDSKELSGAENDIDVKVNVIQSA